jgi:hypothetical protein
VPPVKHDKALNKTDCNIQRETTTLPHQIAVKGQSKHRDVLYQLHQTKQSHLETSKVSWSTGLHHHVQHNQEERQSALQPKANKMCYYKLHILQES